MGPVKILSYKDDKPHVKPENIAVWGIDMLCVALSAFVLLGGPRGSLSEIGVTSYPQNSHCTQSSLSSGAHSLQGIAGPSSSTRYWILRTEGTPVALLRDDNQDSSPDRAFLFVKESGSAEEAKLDFVDCKFWKTPISHFLLQMEREHRWTPELARGHRWVSFLERLGEFGIWEHGSRSEGLSVLDEEVAHRLFELLNDSLAPQLSELNVETMWEQVQGDVEKMLAWVGVQTLDVLPEGASHLRLEGLKAPLSIRNYRAPMLYVKNASKQQTRAVFDVLLFNDWATQVQWQRRISGSP